MRLTSMLALVLVSVPAFARADEPPADAAAPTTIAAADPTPAPGDLAATDATPTVEKRHKRKSARPDFRLGAWRGTVEASAELVGGALSGRSTLREDGAVLDLGADVEPAIERGRWRLALPVEVGHRETPGAEQRETRGGVGVDARYRTGPDFRLDLDGGLRFAHRPGWLDEYQPLAGALGTTDRYSHLDLRLGAAITAIPLRHQHLRAGLRYTKLEYADDPNYDAIDTPTHLVPGDRGELELELSWRHFGHGYKVGGGLALEDQRDDVNFARDAGTGKTHAGAGGLPPNPLYHEVDVEPSLGAEIDLAGGSVELGADLGYEIASDRYQGYYSRSGLHPEVHASLARGRLTTRLSAEARLSTYGPNSYQSDGTTARPPLESGDRRTDRKLSARASGGYRVGRHLEVIGSATVVRRDTNFPDYVPGVFPEGRQYDVRWDYTNWEATVGLRLAR